jgi:ketosteroid isomerase-like protein
MRILIGVLSASLVLGGAGASQAASDSGPVATIHQFIDSFDKGDMKGAMAAHAPGAVIIDEVAPHAWTGPNAVQDWAADLAKDDKASGQTEESVKLGKATRVQVDGDTAYVVIASSFNYKQHGKAITEPASMTYALKKGPDGWKITAWSWNGGTPRPAAAKATKP